MVDNILNRGVDPNATATKNAVVGSVAGARFVFTFIFYLFFCWFYEEKDFINKLLFSTVANRDLKKSQPFPSSGSTPPVFLAATRGYHQVVEVKCFQTAL